MTIDWKNARVVAINLIPADEALPGCYIEIKEEGA